MFSHDNSFSQITVRSFDLHNSFFRIAIRSLDLHNSIVRLDCNSFPREKNQGRNCNHCVLPLHCWGVVPVVPVSPEVALLLSSTWSSVGALNKYTIHQVTSLFPFTRFHFSIPLLIVDKSVLHRVAGMHEIVQDAANFHDALRCLWAMLLRSEKYLKPVGQDAEGVYYHCLAFENL